MNTYKLCITYDGTDYQGWQSQPHKKTIVDVLQGSFARIFGSRITLLGASRTDAGVHAHGQIARLQTDLAIDPERMKHAWNSSLPLAICIRDILPVSEDFHPHKNVIEKSYCYRLFRTRPLPLDARFGWLYTYMHQVDVGQFIAALQLYVGTHDFRSFCKLDEEKSTVRTVYSIAVAQEPAYIDIRIRGDGFLRYQIRRMIGYALDVARRTDKSLDDIRQMIKQPNAQQTLLKAGAAGLCLEEVCYR